MPKPTIADLAGQVRRLEEQLRERDGRLLGAIDDLRRSIDSLAVMAVTDPLTGLSNRRHFEDGMRREFRRARRHQHPIGVVLIDVDQLKEINDARGHPAGDGAIIAVADAIRSVQRQSDFAARFGGDEFAVALVQTDVAGAMICAERLVQTVAAQRVALGREAFSLTVSCGVAVLACGQSGAGAVSADSAPELLARADAALLEAKGSGKNRVVMAR